MPKFLKEILPFIIIVAAIIIVRLFVITPVTVSGASMEKTLNDKEVMLLYKFNRNNIKRYDIVVLTLGKERLIKRVIALPNEKIRCTNGIIYINDEEKSNEYGYGNNMDFEEITLKSNEYFVMGDNRENSLDSRYFGPVDKEQILGNTNFVIFPFTKWGKVK